MATWKGQGVGKLLPDGSVSYRGAVYYSTASPQLAGLNTIATVFEYDVDANGYLCARAGAAEHLSSN